MEVVWYAHLSFTMDWANNAGGASRDIQMPRRADADSGRNLPSLSCVVRSLSELRVLIQINLCCLVLLFVFVLAGREMYLR